MVSRPTRSKVGGNSISRCAGCPAKASHRSPTTPEREGDDPLAARDGMRPASPATLRRSHQVGRIGLVLLHDAGRPLEGRDVLPGQPRQACVFWRSRTSEDQRGAWPVTYQATRRHHAEAGRQASRNTAAAGPPASERQRWSRGNPGGGRNGHSASGHTDLGGRCHADGWGGWHPCLSSWNGFSIQATSC